MDGPSSSYLDSDPSDLSNYGNDSDTNSEYDNDHGDGCEVTKTSVVQKLINRELFGRFSKRPKVRSEKLFNEIPDRCHYMLTDIIPRGHTEILSHVFMGFTQCGRFLVTYKTSEDAAHAQTMTMSNVEFVVYIWSYIPNRHVRKIANYKVFRHYKGPYAHDVVMCQWPKDYDKLVVFGTYPHQWSEAYLTIITLPSMRKCNDCSLEMNRVKEDNSKLNIDMQNNQIKCVRHGVSIDAMISLMPPYPKFKPKISLAYPEYIILNSGHFLYALHVTLPRWNRDLDAQKNAMNTLLAFQEPGAPCLFSTTPSLSSYLQQNYPDNVSEVSESVKYDQELLDLCQFETTSCVSDISDCEFEAIDGMSTRSYRSHNSDATSTSKLESNKPQLQIFLHKNKEIKTENVMKSADNTYEFTEETEKFEMISSFRKRKLAEKKYEFSEDNSENIIPPISLLRKQRSVIRRAGGGALVNNPMSRLQISCQSPDTSRFRVMSQSPDIVSPPFLSPRTTTNHSPIYISSFVMRKSSSTNSNSSPRGGACHDSDTDNCTDKNVTNNCGLLAIIDEKSGYQSIKSHSQSQQQQQQYTKRDSCLREFIRRYSAIDFETTSSRLSETQRDDYVSVELPVSVHTVCCGEEYHLDVVPNNISNITGPYIKIVHRIFDIEQFCHREAKRICSDNDLLFKYCQDYDIKIANVCPLSGVVTSTAYIEVGADQIGKTIPTKSRVYVINFCFTWDVNVPGGGACAILGKNNPRPHLKLQDADMNPKIDCEHLMPPIPTRKVHVMEHNYDNSSLTSLTNEEHLIHVTLDKHPGFHLGINAFVAESNSEDDDMN